MMKLIRYFLTMPTFDSKANNPQPVLDKYKDTQNKFDELKHKYGPDTFVQTTVKKWDEGAERDVPMLFSKPVVSAEYNKFHGGTDYSVSIVQMPKGTIVVFGKEKEMNAMFDRVKNNGENKFNICQAIFWAQDDVSAIGHNLNHGPGMAASEAWDHKNEFFNVDFHKCDYWKEELAMVDSIYQAASREVNGNPEKENNQQLIDKITTAFPAAFKDLPGHEGVKFLDRPVEVKPLKIKLDDNGEISSVDSVYLSADKGIVITDRKTLKAQKGGFYYVGYEKDLETGPMEPKLYDKYLAYGAPFNFRNESINDGFQNVGEEAFNALKDLFKQVDEANKNKPQPVVAKKGFTVSF